VGECLEQTDSRLWKEVEGRRTIFHAASHYGGSEAELNILRGECDGFEAGGTYCGMNVSWEFGGYCLNCTTMNIPLLTVVASVVDGRPACMAA